MVRVLFDQGTPRGPRRHLREHEIDTLHELHWHREKNGDLLDLAEGARYETFVTTEKERDGDVELIL